MKQYKVDYESAGRLLRGKVKVDSSFGIFTANEIGDILCNHLYFTGGKFGNELVEKQSFNVTRITSYDVLAKSFAFELEIDNFTDSEDTHIFLDVPELEKNKSVDFTASENRLTYIADISELPPDALLEVYATGMSVRYIWRNFIASVIGGEIVSKGSLPFGNVALRRVTDRLASVTISEGQIVVRLRKRLPDKHNAVRLRILKRVADKNLVG